MIPGNYQNNFEMHIKELPQGNDALGDDVIESKAPVIDQHESTVFASEVVNISRGKTQEALIFEEFTPAVQAKFLSDLEFKFSSQAPRLGIILALKNLGIRVILKVPR